MDTIIVTGGAGFIGSNYVRWALEQRDEQIVVLDKLTYAGSLENLIDILEDSRVEFVQGDIANAACVAEVFARHRPTAVLNFAAESHVDRSIDSPATFMRSNIRGTFELLEASRRMLRELDDAARKRFRLLHVSTDEVFGSLGAEGAFSETTAYAPNSPYSASKAAADHLVRAWYHTFDVPTLMTNCSNNYGPHQFPEKLIPLMILNALEGKPLPIYGDGLNVRDWLYVEDHCAGIDLVLRKGRVGESYNLGGNSEQTNIAVVDTICALLDRLRPPAAGKLEIKSYSELKTFVEDRKGHDRRYAIDASKIHGELGWKPQHDFTSGMEATVRWYLDNREWCDKIQRQSDYSRERLGQSE